MIDYCENREEWRNEIIIAWDLKNNKYAKLKPTDKKYSSPKEIAKNLIIRILYGGGVDRWLKAWEIESSSCPSNIHILVAQVKKIQKPKAVPEVVYEKLPPRTTRRSKRIIEEDSEESVNQNDFVPKTAVKR